MQKKSLVLAVAVALASGAVLAQSSVTVYGLVDIGYTNRGDATVSGAGSKNEINSNQVDDSKIGFTGEEDLGNGNKALFVLEAVFHADDGNINGQRLFNKSFLGLSGNWGKAIAGRMTAPRASLLTDIDPFAAGSIGGYFNVYSDGPGLSYDGWDPYTVSNVAAYVSPSFGGFNVTAAYATNALDQETLENDGDFKTRALLPRYTNGPLDIGFSWQRITRDASIPTGVTGLPAPLDDPKLTALTLGGTYDFDVVKLGAFYDRTRLKTSNLKDITHKVWHLGVTVPLGKHAVLASYTQSRYDEDNNLGYDGEKAKQWALGYTYALSRRTSFYAFYSDIHNDDGRMASVDDSSNDGAIYNAAGDKIGAYERGIQIGLMHTF
ncbi:MAG: porin [Zoogloeaceae bacterium]|jgi:predicted porin|nr:porin [Zoogloeaceae bacterium]